jgi:glyoxylase-like metal-dependent hydrolase (beta-lactamase superfamily II)
VKNVKIYPIVTGYAKCDEGTYLFMKGAAGTMREIPMICFYIEGLEKKCLVDTGICDIERANKYHHPTQKKDAHQVHEALELMHVSPDEIELIVFTHLHWDHCHNMGKFKNATYIAHEEEVAFAHDPLPPYYRSYESPVWNISAPFVGKKIETVSGEQEIIPGLRVFHTPGHSPGSMSVSVEAQTGTYILPGDAVFLYRNLQPKEDEHWRFWLPQRYVNVIELWNSLEIISERMDSIEYVLPAHEIRVLEKEYYT